MADEENNPGMRTERRDAARNRQLILDTASRLFEQYGVEQVSMNQIATEAQIGPGTLYRRYGSKGEICRDLIKDSMDLFFEDVDAYLKESGTISPEQKLREVLKLFIRFKEKKAQLLAGVEEAGSTDMRKPRARGPFHAELHQIIAGLFREIEADGQAPAHSVFKADMVLMALSGRSYCYQKMERGYSPDQILDLICSTFIAGNA